MIPLVGFDTHFNPNGIVLRDNGFGLGDIEPGIFYQHAPFLRDGRPVFSYRVEFDFIAPVGSFNSTRDINQGSGFFSLNPYVSATFIPLPGLEFSTRIQYLYNFSTSRFSNPPPVLGVTYGSGQAGQAAYLNFDASYAVAEKLSLGVNGFYFRQLDKDRLNGVSIDGSRVTQLYVGPGLHATLSPKNILNVNAYLPIDVRDTTSGPRFNFELIHVF